MLYASFLDAGIMQSVKRETQEPDGKLLNRIVLYSTPPGFWYSIETVHKLRDFLQRNHPMHYLPNPTASPGKGRPCQTATSSHATMLSKVKEKYAKSSWKPERIQIAPSFFHFADNSISMLLQAEPPWQNNTTSFIV
jgi:hypothetical protein